MPLCGHIDGIYKRVSYSEIILWQEDQLGQCWDSGDEQPNARINDLVFGFSNGLPRRALLIFIS